MWSQNTGAGQTIYNPVDMSHELTSRPDVKKQVERFRNHLAKTLPKLAILLHQNCTRQQARGAWDWIFNHDFWAKREAQLGTATSAYPNTVTIRCGLARKKGALVYKDYKSGAFVLPKGRALKFKVASTDVNPPYSVHWKCFNEGDEAADAGQLNWEKTEDICWTSTQFKGRQKMICEIEKDGRVVAQATYIVKISEEGWGNPND